MKLRARRGSSTPRPFVSPGTDKKKANRGNATAKREDWTSQREASFSPSSADEAMTILECNDDQEMNDAVALLVEDLNAENEVNLLLELCMANEGVSIRQLLRDENSDPNIKDQKLTPKSKAEESLDELLDIDLGDLNEIMSPSSPLEATGTIVDYRDGMSNDAPPLEIHAHSAFAPYYYPVTKTYVDEEMFQVMVPPAAKPCERCEYWANNSEVLTSHFIYKLKQCLDESESEFYKWNSDGRSFTLIGHPETDFMLSTMLQTQQVKILSAFRRKLCRCSEFYIILFKSHLILLPRLQWVQKALRPQG